VDGDEVAGFGGLFEKVTKLHGLFVRFYVQKFNFLEKLNFLFDPLCGRREDNEQRSCYVQKFNFLE
jgi:hypothetical protein